MKLFKLKPQMLIGPTTQKLYIDVVNAKQNFANQGQGQRYETHD